MDALFLEENRGNIYPYRLNRGKKLNKLPVLLGIFLVLYLLKV
jgi:hypothetical protein